MFNLRWRSLVISRDETCQPLTAISEKPSAAPQKWLTKRLELAHYQLTEHSKSPSTSTWKLV
jgi:hypothetical protein